MVVVVVAVSAAAAHLFDDLDLLLDDLLDDLLDALLDRKHGLNLENTALEYFNIASKWEAATTATTHTSTHLAGSCATSARDVGASVGAAESRAKSARFSWPSWSSLGSIRAPRRIVCSSTAWSRRRAAMPTRPSWSMPNGSLGLTANGATRTRSSVFQDK
ncbi:hypothetical protein DL89DRAFT_56820 [Linderina pennispora]|uniref:Uncharacterized protein n=1 Tax=Linderina pennispora TaxID=61395 RepID=A0A1Y1W257_9FUNG|nr:uncharacterized protein DL89DRAFT_56820 [Linderina pennispora]ORX67326.1 hypothetical protein DL89DRAFT_56820 [Linderina pennispora]